MAAVTTVKTINVARDFSRYPGGRFYDDGDWSAQAFRETILVPNLRTFTRTVAQLDGTLGYGGSWLEEAFGGLVRVEGFRPETLRHALTLETTNEALRARIWGYIEAAGS